MPNGHRRFVGLVCLVTSLAACGDRSPVEPGAACPAGPLLTVPILQLADIDHITPLGNLNPPGHHTFPTSHTYWNVASPGARRVDVFAPADVVVTRIDRLQFSHDPDVADYTLQLEVCAQVQITLFHLGGVSDALASALTGQPTCRTDATLDGSVTNCSFTMRRAVAAGVVIGHAGDTQAGGIDVGLIDTRVSSTIANPARFGGMTHAACPVDYYVAGVRAQLETRFGDFLTTRTAPPVCGRFAFDVPGTAQGNWVMVGAGQNPENHGLALVRDNVIPEAVAISIGLLGSMRDGWVLHFVEETTGSVRRAFDQVAAGGGIHCYDGLNSTRYLTPGHTQTDLIVLVQLGSDGRLRFETRASPSCGAGPWSFTGAAITLER